MLLHALGRRVGSFPFLKNAQTLQVTATGPCIAAKVRAPPQQIRISRKVYH
jgi:hypothetical protein